MFPILPRSQLKLVMENQLVHEVNTEVMTNPVEMPKR